MTGNSFTWNVSVDGVNIADIAVDGEASITYGRTDILDQPTPAVATIELLTIDVAPDYIANYPQFTLGQHGISSGFADAWSDTYLGDQVAVTLGAPVSIQADTPSGFKDEWVDTYNDGENLPRFVGTISAIDWEPDRITLTAVDALSAATRQNVTPDNWPPETDVARAARIWPGITAYGPGADVIARTDTQTSTRFDLLVNLATETGGLVWCERDGTVSFQSITAPSSLNHLDLPDYAVLIEPLKMSVDYGELVNEWVTSYGNKPTDADRPTITVSDTDSATQFGLSQRTLDTQFATVGDAGALTADLLALTKVPRWNMPDCEVNLGMANDADAAALAALNLGDTVSVGELLAGAPELRYSAQVLGVTETLSATDWTMNLHLAPGGAAPTLRKAR